jgi:hypothetical protein
MGTDCSTSARTAAVAGVVSHLLARSGASRWRDRPPNGLRCRMPLARQEALEVQRGKVAQRLPGAAAGAPDRQLGGGRD